MIDTTAVKAECFVKPTLPGHSTLNMTAACFLIENERIGRKAMFDLAFGIFLEVHLAVA